MTLSLIIIVCFYLTANLVSLNGKTTIEIANRLPVLFTPSNFTFIIWGIIYTFLAIWIYGFWSNRRKINLPIIKKRSIYFNLSSLFSVMWILLWHYGFFNWSIVVMGALLATLTALYFTYPKTENLFLQRVPISLYLGWIIILFIENMNYLLTLWEWSGWGVSISLWTVIFLTIAAAIALHFLYHHKDIPLNFVFMWAFIGIALKNGFDSLFVTSVALFLTAVIGISFFLIKQDKYEKSPAQ